MTKIAAVMLMLASSSSHAEINGRLTSDSGNSEAKLILEERGVIHGTLSQLFDGLGVPATVSRDGVVKAKNFSMSNRRFTFACKRASIEVGAPVTACTWIIRAGDNTGDMNTFIMSAGDQKVATLGMTSAFAKELTNVFPSDSSGNVSVLVTTDNHAFLEIKGASWGNMTVGFSNGQ